MKTDSERERERERETSETGRERVERNGNSLILCLRDMMGKSRKK